MSNDVSRAAGPDDLAGEAGGAVSRAGIREREHDTARGVAAGCESCSVAAAPGACSAVADDAAPGGAAVGEPTPPTGCSTAAASRAARATWRERACERFSVIPPVALAPIVLGLLIAGLMLGDAVGAALLGIAVLILAGLFLLTWPKLTIVERALRVAVLVFVLGVAVIRLVPN